MSSESSTQRANRSPFITGALLAGALALGTGLVIASGVIPHRVAYDQTLYHEEAIRRFAQQWPAVDLSDYLSATTPGYHLLMAGVWEYIFPGTRSLQVASAVIGCVLVLLLGLAAGSLARARTAFVFSLPFIASMYIFASAAYVLPDNAGWLGVLAMLLLALSPAQTLRTLALGGIVLTLLVLTRQVHFWTAGLLWGAAWLSGTPRAPQGETGGTGGGGEGVCANLFARPLDRLLPVALALLATLPAALILVTFYGAWGGLVPPTFQLQYKAPNAAGFAFLLAVIGVISCFYGLTLAPILWRLVREKPVWVVLAAAGALLAALLPRTTAGTPEDYFSGRRTGLWEIAAKLPMIGGHSSLLIVLCAVAGGVALAGWLWVWPMRQRLVLLAAVVGYGAALGASTELWQRYAEPFALMIVLLCACRAHGAPVGVPGFASATAGLRPGLALLLSRGVWLGPLALALAFALLTARDLHKPDTRRIGDAPPPAETSGPGEPPPRADSPWSRYMMSRQELDSVRPGGDKTPSAP
jgi:hypothetical protein